MGIYLFRSLRHRNFRLYYLGQLLSLNGTWMQSVAQSWLVYRLTGSGTMLGLVGAFTLAPSLLFGFYGGWLADHFARRQLLIIAQVLAMLQAMVLAGLTILGLVQPWHILVLALLLGVVQAMETPVRHSFISQLVPRADLANAIALNSSMFHLARFFGPAIAGILVAWVGEGPVFLLNAMSFIAVLISLFYVRLPAPSSQADAAGAGMGIWSGLHFVRNHALVRNLLILVASVSLLGSSMVVLMPVFVVRIYGQGAEMLGLLMGMLGAGSLTGALLLANRRDYRLLERRIALAGVLVAVGLILFAVNHWHNVALLLLFIIGFAATTVFSSSNALIQLSAPDRIRGRVMALFSIALQGMISIGQLVMGRSADLLGVSSVVAGAGSALLVLTLVLAVGLLRYARIQQHTPSREN
ncbi:MAG: MFS transporter [Gammaproteobacteria bacterium]